MNPHTITTPPPTIAGAQTQGVDKPSTADPTCSCPSQTNTALTTDGFKDDGVATAQQGEGVAAAAAEDEAQPAEGDQQPKHARKVSQGAQSGSLSEAEERLRKEGGAQGEGKEVGEAKNTAEGDDKW